MESGEEHLRQRAADDAALANDTAREAVEREGIINDEKGIMDAISRMLSEPVPDHVQPPKPTRA